MHRGTVLSLVGNLADLSLGDIFQIVSLSRRTGTLQLKTATDSGELVFDHGNVVCVFRTSASESAGEGLLRAGVITPTDYQVMLRSQGDGVTGKALFERFGLNNDVVTTSLRAMLKEHVYIMLAWDEGTFSFVLEDKIKLWRGFSLAASRIVCPAGVSPQFLAMEGARLRDERSKGDVLDQFLARTPRAPLEPEESDFADLDDERLAPSFKATKVIPFPVDRTRGPTPQGPLETFHPPQTRSEHDMVAARARKKTSFSSAQPHVGTVATTLLVVDDDPALARLVAEEMHTFFQHVEFVSTVRRALTVLESHEGAMVAAVDLIIARADGRGILGGLEVVEAAKERNIECILFSDYDNSEAEARAKALGATTILHKPRKAALFNADHLPTVSTRGFLDNLLDALRHLSPAVAVPLRKVDPVIEPDVGEEIVDDIEYDLGAALAEDIGDELLNTLPILPPREFSDGAISNLRSMLAELSDPSNRDNITLLILRFASEVAERGALFLAARRTYVGLGGFSVDCNSEEFVTRVRQIKLPGGGNSVLDQVRRYRSMVRGTLDDNPGNRGLLAGLDNLPSPVVDRSAFAVPLITGKRVAAILYGDNPSGAPLGDSDALEIFVQQAGVTMDRALLERRLAARKGK